MTTSISPKGRHTSRTRLRLDRLEDRAVPASMIANYGQLPLAFEMNQGQAADADFFAHGAGYDIALNAGDAVLTVGEDSVSTALQLKLVGANPSVCAVASDPLVTRVNYMIGKDRSQWHTNIPTFGDIAYQNVYDGIDIDYHSNQSRLEYDFIVNPGAEPKTIRMALQGMSGMKLDRHGNLVLQTAAGDVTQHAPVAYQIHNGVRETVPARFRLFNDNAIGFRIGKYDSSLPLVIDPVVSYGTYLPYRTKGMAVDSAGNAYVTGDGAYNFDRFVAKLNPAGTALVYLTYGIGGEDIAVDSAGNAYAVGGALDVLDSSGSSLIYSTVLTGAGELKVAVDSAGNAYLTGHAGSGLPVTAGAFQSSKTSSSDVAFFAIINPNLPGTASIVYCSYLGGTTAGAAGTGVAVDASGNAYISGYTDSSDFPTTAGAFRRTYGGNGDAFVAKFNPTLSGAASLVYSTYLGGSEKDADAPLLTLAVYPGVPGANYSDHGSKGTGIAVDSAGNAYVAGHTKSANFPVTAGAYKTSSGMNNSTGGLAFVTKLNAAGSGLVYSTFLGTAVKISGKTPSYGWARETAAMDIAVDGAGNAYVAGLTASDKYPLTNATQATFGGLGDAFVTKLNSSGSSLLFSTYLGGESTDFGTGIGLDASNNLYVAGRTASTTFPVTPGAYQTTKPSLLAGFAARINGV